MSTLAILALILGGSYTSPVYPQGISCDPVTGIIYNLQPANNPDGFIRVDSKCKVDRETGMISCSGIIAPPTGLTITVH